MPILLALGGRPSNLKPLAEARRTKLWTEWRALAAESPPLLSPEVVLLTLPFVEGEPVIAEARRDGALSGVLPLVRRGRSLESIRSDHTPQYDFVGTAEALEEVWGQLLREPGWDTIVLEKVPDSSVLMKLPEMARRHGCHAVVRPGEKHAFIELKGFEDRLPSKFRANLRRCDRKLGGTTLQRVTRFSRSALEEALEIEQAAWKGSAGTSIASDRLVQHYYAAIARLFARRGQMSLDFLVSQEKRIATLLTVEDDRVLYAIKIGYDPAVAAMSPGHLLVWRVAADAERRGLSQFDFIGHPDEWKLRWTDRTHDHAAIVIYRNSVLGGARYAFREIAKPRLPEAALHPETLLQHGCQQSCLVGGHTRIERIRGRIQNGLGIKSGLQRLFAPRRPPPGLGEPSAFHPGDWVRVLDAERLRAVLDAREQTRGLVFVPQQWQTCGKIFRVQSVVRRIRDDADRMRAVKRTVLLEGADCTGDGEPKGCGRHCPLLYRDEWLEPAEPPQKTATQARPCLHARVRSMEEIRETLDLTGRRDGLLFMPEMAQYAGKRERILRRVERVFELDRWVAPRAPIYVLEGLHCTGAVLGTRAPCHRGCALLWHGDWLSIEPHVS